MLIEKFIIGGVRDTSAPTEIPVTLLKAVIKRHQIIVAVAASPVPLVVVFVADRILVWSEAGIDTVAHLLDNCQAPAEAVVVDTPAGRTGEVADNRAGTAVVAVDNRVGTAVVADLAEAQPCSRYCLYQS